MGRGLSRDVNSYKTERLSRWLERTVVSTQTLWHLQLQLERTQILPEIFAELLVFKSNFDGGLQKS